MRRTVLKIQCSKVFPLFWTVWKLASFRDFAPIWSPDCLYEKITHFSSCERKSLRQLHEILVPVKGSSDTSLESGHGPNLLA